jgi:hypothetical protein
MRKGMRENSKPLLNQHKEIIPFVKRDLSGTQRENEGLTVIQERSRWKYQQYKKQLALVRHNPPKDLGSYKITGSDSQTMQFFYTRRRAETDRTIARKFKCECTIVGNVTSNC